MFYDLDELFSKKPRGPEIGDQVCLKARDCKQNEYLSTFRVVALQRIVAERVVRDVGLVWAFTCIECDAKELRFTPIRPLQLNPLCGRCDVVGAHEPEWDAAAVRDLARPAAGPWPVVRSADTLKAKGIRRRGRMESHVIQVMKDFDGDTVKLEDLIDRAVALFPAPEDGERDTRRQRITRAIQTLAKEKDGPIGVAGDTVILYE